MNAEPVVLRLGVTRDLAAMVEIERSSFSDPWSEAALAEEFDSALPPVVVECEGEVRGYLCLVEGPDEWHVTNLAVHPNWRRRGLATLLLENTIEAARRAACDELLLEVRPSNQEARRLYERLGFVELYRRRRYYIRPSEDGLVLALALNSEPANGHAV